MGTLKVDTIQDSGGNTILSSDGSGGFSNSLPAGKTSNFRNFIINGDMSLAQRGTSFSDIAHNTYFLDRYRFHKTNTSELVMNLDQSTDVPSAQGLSNSLKLTVGTAESATASNELVAIGTKIEAQNLQQLKYGTSSAETLTLSFWVKSSVTGTYTIMVFQQDASSSPDRRYYSKSFSINSANTWEKKTIQITGNQDDTIANDNGIGFDLRINLSAGSSYTSGSSDTWGDSTNTAVGQTANFSGTSSATFFFTGVQLEVGTTASDFEFVPYEVNLQRCQRYFQTYQSGGMICWSGTTVSGANYFQQVRHLVQMRASATIGNFTVAGLNGFASGDPSIDYDDPLGFRASKQSNGNTNEAYFMYKYTADAEL